MGIFKSLFTWWDGPTIGTRLFSSRKGDEVGRDSQGNIYMRAKDGDVSGREQRWVIYAGENEASRVPPEWHGWLHHTSDEVPHPERKTKPWVRQHRANPTGTADVYVRPGAIPSGGRRERATGDYEAWTPSD